MLIEDDEVDELFARRVLEPAFVVESVPLFARGLSALEQGRFDVILLDLSLPDGDGVSLIDDIRERDAMTPVVVLTGANCDDLAYDAIRRGAQDYLVKSRISRETLPRVLRYAVERAALRNRLSEANDELTRLEEEARATSVQKSRFVANVSHELRTPLTAVLGFSEVLRAEVLQQNQEGTLDALAIIERSAEHLLSLINDLLDLSKIEAGKIALEARPTRLREILSDVTSLVDESARRKGLKISFQCEDDAPTTILVDATRLRQVLLNLMGNAVKFTSSGEVKLSCVERSPASGDSVLQLDVVDTGIGMSPEQQARVFDAFAQAEASTTRQFGGTGLGLTISRKLARCMDGDLTVDSTAGVGTRMSLTIPCTPCADQPSADMSMVDQSDDAPLTDRRILVADDGELNRRLFDRILRQAGAEVHCVNDGHEALDACVDQEFDLIFMDLIMPGVDGLEATRELRKRGVRVPVVALSAHTDAKVRAESREAGCDEYQVKPVSRSELVALAVRLVSPPVAQ